MSNLISSMMSAAGALDAYTSVLDVTQNNVANTSTPGYAKQTESLEAMPFDPAMGLTGGVLASQVESTRDDYAEQTVQQQTTLLGQAQQDVSSLSSLQSQFDVTGSSGIDNAFNNLFQAFSAWGQTPTSTVARQTVIQRATDVATAFQQSATGLATLAQDTNQQLLQTVSDINQISGQLAAYNQQIMGGDRNDAGLDARIHSTLEQLSQYAGITAAKQADGTYSVLLNGQTALVIENRSYGLRAAPAPNDPTAPNPEGPSHQSILSSTGTDVTSTVSGGQLASLLIWPTMCFPAIWATRTNPAA